MIDDPAVLYQAMTAPKHRLVYDKEISKIIELKPELSSKQIDVVYNLTNKTIVSPREFCTKRIHF